MKEVYIVAAKRTPIGSFNGKLSSITAPKLASFAIKAAIKDCGINEYEINEVFIGNVLQAGVGQAPARQASIYSNIPNEVPATTINKVCASGMKAIIIGMQSIISGDNELVVVGGMENMSMVPHYINIRNGIKLGDSKIIDGLVHDGLTDVYNQYHMGVAAELCATEYNITREDQDKFALDSYSRSKKAWEESKFTNEVCEVIVNNRGVDEIINEDEEYKNINHEKVPNLKPVFKKDGTITAANASTINDGASALILVSEEKLKELKLKPLAKIIASADSAQSPEWFTTSPSKAIQKLLVKTSKNINDIDLWEINEAFSVVSLANNKILGLDPNKVNIYGGAVSLGHPLGNSGSRVIVTLLNALINENKKIGIASICNGGGGASAIMIEKI